MIKKKGVKEKKDEIKERYVCPKCKSVDVGRVFGMRNLFGLLSKYRCNKCGHEEVIFPTLKVNSKGKKK